MRYLRENTNLLKDAIKTLQSYRDTLDKDDPEDGSLKWLIQDLTHLFGMKVTEKALAEGLSAILLKGVAEAGAKLSKDSLAKVNAAIAALTDLTAKPDVDTESEDTAEAVFPEIVALISEAKAADCVGPKIAKIMKDRPGIAPKQAQAIAHSMCEDGVADEAVVSKVAEYALALGMTLAEITADPEPSAIEGVIPANVTKLAVPATILREAAGSSNGSVFEVLIIKPGMSGNRVNYSPEVLRESVPLLEGRPMYIDHPSEPGKPRSIRDKVGWYSEVRYDETIAETKDSPVLGGIVGNLHLYENSGSPWFREMVIEALEKGRPQDIGISIYAGAKTQIKKNAEGIYRDVDQITVYASADAVAEPGAGGRPLVLAASTREDHDMDILKTATSLREVLEKAPELSMKEIREARPDFFTAEGAPIWETTPEPTPAPTPVTTPVAESVPAPVTSTGPDPAIAALTESMQAIQRQNTQLTLDRVLAETRIPRQIWPKVREKVGTQILTQSQLEEIVSEYGDILDLAGSVPDNNGVPMPSNPSLVVPFGSIRQGANSVDLVRAALDQWFGLPIEETLKGKFQPIRSFRQFYQQVTGDYGFDGVYHPEHSVIGEALPTAAALIGSPPQAGGVTFAGLTGTSMNRALTRMYNEQARWWEPVVAKTDIDNMKQQDRIRRHNFGSLTERVEDGAEYTELTWGETVETWTPTEYGNLVTIGRRMIINDDLRALREMPALLARSARVTINEYVGNFFTANAGSGVALADTFNWFDAGNHQGNRLTAALSRAALLAARKVQMKMTDNAGKRIEATSKILLVSVDDEALAWELVSTPLVPDSANNARNILADGQRGIDQVIVVPQFTDTNNWYLLSAPSDIVSIEMGFLFGRDTPELLSQQDPLTGLVWTNDVISHKVRWDFGGDVIDYRGGVGNVVA